MPVDDPAERVFAMPVRTCLEAWVTCIVGERRIPVAREAIARSSERTIAVFDPERHNALSFATLRGLISDARRQRTVALPGDGVGVQLWQLVVTTNQPDVISMLLPHELVVVSRDGMASRVDIETLAWLPAWEDYDERLGAMWKHTALAPFLSPWVQVFTP